MELYPQILVAILIFLGESFSIYAEMIAARTYSLGTQPFLEAFLKMFIVFVFGGMLLISGYMMGFSSFKNIWIVSVISITSILISEPTLAYVIFHQLPTKGAAIGLIFGILGFISTMLL